MCFNMIILASNPFFDAYIQSDILGKLIFIALYTLSICSWIILIHKIWVTHQAKRAALRFHEIFQLQKISPLSLDCEHLNKRKNINPFLALYNVLKKHTLDVLAKNRHFGVSQQSKEGLNQATGSLSLNDIDFVASHLSTMIAAQVKDLEKNLYILSTTVSLAPFLGLLGTVWGILATFSSMQTQSHHMVLNGLSLALATTVLGLLNAIPALIGYNYLKNTIREFATEMECFSNEILTSVELQYRRVDI